MKTLYHIPQIMLILFLFAYCSEAPSWVDSVTDDIPPGVVSDIQVLNIPGGAVITYNLPSDKDILGVKAVYSYSENGQALESFSSAFRDTIEINGFPDITPRKVKLISIDKSRNESQPVEVAIAPLTPPVEIIQESLVIRETFGGVFVSWKNDNRENIGIALYVEDSLGFMNLDYTYYTNAKEENFSFRVYTPKARKFRVQVRDRWGNYSTPKDTLLTPIFEENVVRKNAGGVVQWERFGYLDKTVEWRGDYVSQYSSSSFQKMFDGITSSSGYFNPWTVPNLNTYTGNSAHSAIAGGDLLPIYLTIDMKEETRLSRFRLYYRSGALNANDIRTFSVWATNNTPKVPADFGNDRMKSLVYWTSWPQINGTDAWKNDWVKLGDYVVTPPSGATEQYQWTDQDVAWAQAGVDFDFNAAETSKKFRYLRIVCVNNVKNTNACHFAEWEVYGSYVNK